MSLAFRIKKVINQFTNPKIKVKNNFIIIYKKIKINKLPQNRQALSHFTVYFFYFPLSFFASEWSLPGQGKLVKLMAFLCLEKIFCCCSNNQLATTVIAFCSGYVISVFYDNILISSIPNPSIGKAYMDRCVVHLPRDLKSIQIFWTNYANTS